MAALSGFSGRHIGVNEADLPRMLATVGADSLDTLIKETVPAGIRFDHALDLPPALSEEAALTELRDKLSQNQLFKNWIGTGYSGTHTPAVILRNILENPGWYTAYTPYQAEISQGRLEALVNFQTMVCDLTGMDIANASLLDEATAAAEAMALCLGVKAGTKFYAAPNIHPQTFALLETRAEPLGVAIVSGDPATFDFSTVFGAILQYPATDGLIADLAGLTAKIHAAGAQVIVASDLLALTLLKPPGEWGADAVVGSAQRFGVPLGYGGPHAGFLAVRDAHKRRLPGRLAGVSKDSAGKPAYRLTLQTREQHIRREKATSNICTAQVLLAVIASMYAVYHGPEGLRAIARRVNELTASLAAGLKHLKVCHSAFFDTITIEASDALVYFAEAESRGVNLRRFADGRIGISFDETTTEADVATLLEIFGGSPAEAGESIPADLRRESDFLTHPVFNRYHTETEMMRYLRRLEAKDLSLTTSMIPLGSCTMKLNAASEMLPVTWAHTGALHPFAPAAQTKGYDELFTELEAWLSEITGFAGTSVQPNAGSQGEYAGLLVIRKHHASLGESHRDICLIPTSAHGTNPASAAMAGYRVVAVKCDDIGNIDLSDLRAKIDEHRERVGVLMITYPSTHGVFEDTVKEVCAMVHGAGGQVYMDGANMNAQVGLCSPGHIGADVCHLNLHKTFCIPHGGGGPGVGPVCVAKHLVPFLPGHPLRAVGGRDAIGAISAAPWGSASICVIPWMYIRMMGPDGLKSATEIAILNANYIAKRLGSYFPLLFTGVNGRVAHECILDFREWKTRAGIEVEDIAKRLIDFGFHAPTMSWPVPGTLMIEPTESESMAELDRFCDAMIAIHGELVAIENGTFTPEDNPLVNSPHTAAVVTATEWPHAYSREQAAYPAPWLREHKFWPSVGRIDNVYGDRNIFCSCVPVEEMAEAK